MNKNYVIIFFLTIVSSSAFAKVNPPIMATNSPWQYGTNDSCGGCVSPQICQSGTCVTPTYSTDSADCGVSQTACGANQACLSGSCVSSIDAASCFNGSSYSTCGNGTCGSSGYIGLCRCPSGNINDNNNCGSCGNACTGATAYCSYGQCIDANLCGDGGCAGTVCSGVSNIGGTCTDGNEYAGGDLEVSPTDLTGKSWAQATAYCASLGAGWSLPTVEQISVMYNNNSNVQLSTSTLGYWSSEKGNSSHSWTQNSSGGSQMANSAATNFTVRCVHSL